MRAAPWAASIGLHAGILALGFAVTWSVVRLTEDRQPVIVTAEFDALTYDPLVTLEADPAAIEEPAPVAPAAPAGLDPVAANELADLMPHSVALDLDTAPPSRAEFRVGSSGEAASFVGLTTTNARKIVYVIDASGSMIPTLPIVLQELARSLGALSERQSFGIIFFRRNAALVVPPAGRLTPATPEARRLALEWIDEHVVPSGRSNPLAALEKALGLEPDVIFLLSENITGSGEFEIDQEDLLDLLDRLNPVDRATGARAARINCVQFLDPDPLDTLRKIAERHGGPGGYRFLDRAELGVPGR